MIYIYTRFEAWPNRCKHNEPAYRCKHVVMLIDGAFVNHLIDPTRATQLDKRSEQAKSSSHDRSMLEMQIENAFSPKSFQDRFRYQNRESFGQNRSQIGPKSTKISPLSPNWAASGSI